MSASSKATREQAIALGWSEENVALAENLTTAIAKTIADTVTDTGTEIVSMHIVHCAIGAVLEQSFRLMPDNDARVYFFNTFTNSLSYRIGAMIEEFNVPEGVTRQ